MKTNSLAKRLKELRNLRGMSQEYLAEESRVSLRTIQRIENEESSPTGETIKRLSVALDVALKDLVESKPIEETSDLKGTLIFLKKELSKTNKQSEIVTFKRFITVLSNLKDKELNNEQLNAIESYIKYLELEKIPSFSNEIFKEKLKKFNKYLKTNLRFVPTNQYKSYSLYLVIPFVAAFLSNSKIDFNIKIGVILGGVLLFIVGVFIDARIKKEGRSLSF